MKYTDGQLNTKGKLHIYVNPYADTNPRAYLFGGQIYIPDYYFNLIPELLNPITIKSNKNFVTCYRLLLTLWEHDAQHWTYKDKHPPLYSGTTFPNYKDAKTDELKEYLRIKYTNKFYDNASSRNAFKRLERNGLINTDV